jgi:hypothetical protein
MNLNDNDKIFIKANESIFMLVFTIQITKLLKNEKTPYPFFALLLP